MPGRSPPISRDAQFECLDQKAAESQRSHFGSTDGSWTSMTLVARSPQGRGSPTPLLDWMPAVAEILSRIPARIRSVDISRQCPHGILDWHYEAQAICIEECRLLLPVQVPPEAMTLIGHLAVAYPPGRIWTGDFRFPHRVENASDRQRVVVLIDTDSTPALAGLLPPELAAEPERRKSLAGKAVSALLTERARPGGERVLTQGAA
ncbi:MAG: aspartyl/asparaginyl beta-hydroxylase domain-containing protein [Magnetospirillum sp.]|nr:aspartyl/asparaginyl beta-hydroxylase domain-containing protein [Magnetospirillum sp.]